MAKALFERSGVVGCQLEADGVRLARLPRDPEAAASLLFGHLPVLAASPDAVDEWLGCAAETVRTLCSRWGADGEHLIVSMPSAWVSYHRVRMPAMTDGELEQALGWQLARERGVPQAELCCDYYERGCGGSESRPRRDVIAVSVPAGPLERLESRFIASGLDVQAIDAPAGALARCLTYGASEDGTEKPLMVIALGATTAWILVALGGVPVFVHTFSRSEVPCSGGADVRAMRAVADIAREVGLCLHFLEERGDASIVPDRGCVVGDEETSIAVNEAIAGALSLEVCGIRDVLAPTLRSALPALPRGSVLEEWLIPLGLCIHGAREARVEGRR